MNIGKTLFAQLMDFLPWSTFGRIVTRYGSDRESFTTWAFAIRCTAPHWRMPTS
jgi:hypothetical protein